MPATEDTPNRIANFSANHGWPIAILAAIGLTFFADFREIIPTKQLAERNKLDIEKHDIEGCHGQACKDIAALKEQMKNIMLMFNSSLQMQNKTHTMLQKAMVGQDKKKLLDK